MTPKVRNGPNRASGAAGRSIVSPQQSIIGKRTSRIGVANSATAGHRSDSSLINMKNSSNAHSKVRGYVYVCAGCNKPIKRDKFLLKACDQYWHENCLRCDKCHTRLGELGSTLYNKSNMNLCRQDYLEMFGETGTCSVCNRLICASEMVMRAKKNVYHLECFACQLCSQRFCVGDRFYLCDNKIVCQYDYEEIYGADGQASTANSVVQPVLSTDSLTYSTSTDMVLPASKQSQQQQLTTTATILDANEPERIPDQCIVEPQLATLLTASSADGDVSRERDGHLALRANKIEQNTHDERVRQTTYETFGKSLLSADGNINSNTELDAGVGVEVEASR